MRHREIQYRMRNLGEAVKDFRDVSHAIDHAAAKADLVRALAVWGNMAEFGDFVTYEEKSPTSATLIFDDGARRYVQEVTPFTMPARSCWEYGAPDTDMAVKNRDLSVDDQEPFKPLAGQITRGEWLA